MIALNGIHSFFIKASTTCRRVGGQKKVVMGILCLEVDVVR